MNRFSALLVIIAVIIGGLFWGWSRLTTSNALNKIVPKTADVLFTNITFVINAAGEISPAEQVSVRPEIHGRIAELLVDIGDSVKKGELLFKLDDKELRNQYEAAKTVVERAKLELEKAKKDYERANSLLTENLISEEAYEQVRIAYELAKISLQKAEKDLAVIAENLAKTEVRAPFDCTILTRNAAVGQTVAGSSGFNAGTEVMTIADLNRLVIYAHVNQADVPRIKVGQKVEINIEAVPGLIVTGIVERIAPQATIRGGIKGFETRILLQNSGSLVRPGMTASVRIPVESVTNVLAVPLAAVYTELNPNTGKRERFVYVRIGDRFEKRLVKVGISDYFYAEIQEGLKAGEVVAIEPPPPELIIEGRTGAPDKESNIAEDSSNQLTTSPKRS